jgi:uncharacterized protein YfdQ (DUF2303 family)
MYIRVKGTLRPWAHLIRSSNNNNNNNVLPVPTQAAEKRKVTYSSSKKAVARAGRFNMLEMRRWKLKSALQGREKGLPLPINPRYHPASSNRGCSDHRMIVHA